MGAAREHWPKPGKTRAGCGRSSGVQSGPVRKGPDVDTAATAPVRRVSGGGAWAAIVLAGALYGIAFPPVAWRWLAWICLVPAIVVFNSSTARRAFWGGALLATVGACFTVYWLPMAAVTFYEQSLAVGLALFAGVTGIMVVPYVAAWAWLHQRARTLWPAFYPPVSGAAFVAAELARSRILGGNPWAVFGYTQQSDSLIAQTASLAGVYGISFLLVTSNIAIAEMLSARGRRWSAAVTFSIVLVVGLGAGWLARPPHAVAPARAERVGIVQGNIDLGARWRRELYGQTLSTYLEMTRALLDEKPDLVVWPETAMMFFVDREPLYRASIASFLRGSSAQLLAGAPRYLEDPQTRYFNSVFLLDASGAIRDHYDKEKLLPFAERFPFGGDLVRRNFGRVREFAVGSDTAPLDSSIGRIGVVVCNEAMYPEYVRNRVLGGAQVLANLTNDTWIDDAGYSRMAFDMAALRAVETGRYLIRASTAGPSAIVDPGGRVSGRTPLFTRTSLLGVVEARDHLTWYVRHGDVFAIACCLLSSIALLVALSKGVAAGRNPTG